MGKTASVFLDGEITNDSYYSSVAAIRSNLEWQGQFDDIQITINSCGGDIAEGFAIYDLLRSYGKPITTIVLGQCCSAATIVFLAGDTRLIYENVVAFMVHQAAGGVENATADQMRTVADFIDSFNERMAIVYAEKTGQKADVVAEWMSKDTFMNAQEAFDNGFATAIAKPVTAKLYASRPATAPSSIQPPNTDVMKIIKEQWARITASFNARLANPVIEAKKVTTSTGEELNIAYAGDSIAEGDPVTKDGEAAADGTYTIDGMKVTVKDGKVEKIDTGDTSKDVTASNDTTVTADGSDTTVTASADGGAGDDDDELTTLRAENERLSTENTTLNTRLSTLESNTATITAQMRVLLGSKQSADPKVPAPKGVVKALNVGEDTEDEEDAERRQMLEERANRGKPKETAATE